MGVIAPPRESRFGRKLVPLMVIYRIANVITEQRDYSRCLNSATEDFCSRQTL